MTKNMKKSLFLVFFVLFARLISSAQITFEDVNLETFIKYSLGLSPEDTISGVQIDTLAHLDCSFLDINSLSGIEQLKNITNISFLGNSISDVTPLTLLHSLEYVNLSDNIIQDVSPFELTLSNHVVVDISNNCISDFNFVANNIFLPVEFLGQDNQRTICSPRYENIFSLSAFCGDENTGEVIIQHRAWDSETELGFLVYSNGLTDSAICDGFTYSSAQIFEENDTMSVTLQLETKDSVIYFPNIFESTTLVLPEDSSQIATTNNTFSWHSVENAIGYEMDIFIENDSLVFMAGNIPDTVFIMNWDTLANCSDFTWKVRPVFENYKSAWSNEFHFITRQVPQKPDLPSGNFNACSGAEAVYSVPELAVTDYYLWSILPPEAGVVQDSNSSVIISWSQTFTGEASIWVKAVNLCEESENSDTLSNYVHYSPTANAGVNDTIFSGISTMLYGEGSGGEQPYTFLWTPSSTLSDENIFNPIATPEVSTNYTLTITDGHGCSGQDSVYIFVKNYYTTVWGGIPYLPMILQINSATVDGINLGLGDEIAVFEMNQDSLEICIGKTTILNEFTPDTNYTIVASTDNPSTPDVLDGFVSGNEIIFRLWQQNENQEIILISSGFHPSGDSIYQSSGQAIVTLDGYTYETWTGAQDTIWSNTANWNFGLIPSHLFNVIIPESPIGNRYPTISTINAKCRSLIIEDGALLKINGKLEISIE